MNPCFFYATSADGDGHPSVPFGLREGVFKPMRTAKNTPRPDKHGGPHSKQYEINRKKILATQSICGICGKPVDPTLRYPHPLSACVDHIIPVAKGGHPSDIANLQLAHWTCNRSKSDKMTGTAEDYANRRERAKIVGFRNLPLSADWINA